MTTWLDDGDVRLYHGDALETVRGLPDSSVDCVVTSPPYWGLRDYGTPGQMGLESTPEEFVAGQVELFREIRRVLAPHGTCWVNLGDSYAGTANGRSRFGQGGDEKTIKRPGYEDQNQGGNVDRPLPSGLKQKDLCGIPWRVAFALQADGWWLRADIIWAKPNPMPESVSDRPTKAHEYVFLLTKQSRYWFDAEAVREPHDPASIRRAENPRNGQVGIGKRATEFQNMSSAWDEYRLNPGGRNVRSVWQIATQPYPEAHFATYPEELARRCILAGCPERVCLTCGKPSERIVERRPMSEVCVTSNGEKRQGRETQGLQSPKSGLSPSRVTGMPVGPEVQTVGWSDCGHNNWRTGVVLDPFIGSGTTAKVARDHQRHAIGIDLSREYLELAARRLQQLSLLNDNAA